MHKIVYTIQAKKDLEQIQQYISLDNERQANVVVDAIISFINVNLSIFPKMGVIADQEMKIRTIVEQKYRYKIVYKLDGKSIEIYAVYKYKNMSI